MVPSCSVLYRSTHSQAAECVSSSTNSCVINNRLSNGILLVLCRLPPTSLTLAPASNFLIAETSHAFTNVACCRMRVDSRSRTDIVLRERWRQCALLPATHPSVNSTGKKISNAVSERLIHFSSGVEMVAMSAQTHMGNSIIVIHQLVLITQRSCHAVGLLSCLTACSRKVCGTPGRCKLHPCLGRFRVHWQ